MSWDVFSRSFYTEPYCSFECAFNLHCVNIFWTVIWSYKNAKYYLHLFFFIFMFIWILGVCKKQDFCCRAKCLEELAAEGQGQGRGGNWKDQSQLTGTQSLIVGELIKVSSPQGTHCPSSLCMCRCLSNSNPLVAVSVNLTKSLSLAFSTVPQHCSLLQNAPRVLPMEQVLAFYRARPGSPALLPHSASR